jgi:tRNA threonylcarbamoyladenosine biosynthesis protein TsaB
MTSFASSEGGAELVLVLGIETATPTASVGLAEEDCVLAERSLGMTRNHAVAILPLIDETLQDGGVGLRDVDAVAVSIGPGSFTGLRVGLSVAKGLVLVGGMAIVGVPTLEVLAQTAAADGVPICTVLDARRGEVYTAAFRCCHGGVECIHEATVVSLEHLASYVPSPCRMIGDLVDTRAAFLRERLGPGVAMVPGVAPSGAVVARMGARRIQSSGPDDPFGLEPVYLRIPDAEWKRAAKC